MTITSDRDGPWRRLGELLTARRIELGYPKRLPFAREHNLSHDRALSDLENARRTNFDAATLAQVEQIYRRSTSRNEAVIWPSPI